MLDHYENTSIFLLFLHLTYSLVCPCVCLSLSPFFFIILYHSLSLLSLPLSPLFPHSFTFQLMQLEELNPEGCTFLGTGESADLDLLEHSLRVYSATHTGYKQGVEGRDGGPTGGVSAVFTEFPSNPLLKCPDLHR